MRVAGRISGGEVGTFEAKGDGDALKRRGLSDRIVVNQAGEFFRPLRAFSRGFAEMQEVQKWAEKVVGWDWG